MFCSWQPCLTGSLTVCGVTLLLKIAPGRPHNIVPSTDQLLIDVNKEKLPTVGTERLRFHHEQ